MFVSTEYDGKYGEEWPLTVKEILTIDTNQNTMIELLNLSDVLGRLRSSNVINKRQEASISSESTPFKKTEVLLEILRRRSLCDYRNTISCLENSNQNRIAELLKSGGGRPRVLCINLRIETRNKFYLIFSLKYSSNSLSLVISKLITCYHV